MERLERIKSNILTTDQLVKRIAMWRFFGKTIVFTNGCFDILHLGHIEYLAKARDLGHMLVVGLNSDDSVRRLKGPSRPVNPEEARSVTLASLSFVDAVCIFDEDTPYNLINLVRPDILVKGKDYDGKEIVGADIVEANGGKVITIALTEGFSTTETIKKSQPPHPTP